VIKKTNNGFLIRCDKCGIEEEVDTHDDMFVFKEMIKESGWKSKKKYQNICADCAGG